MKVVCTTYFQEPEGVWRQPGTTWDCDPDHRRIKAGQVIPYTKALAKGIPIETAVIVQPEVQSTRPRQPRKPQRRSVK